MYKKDAICDIILKMMETEPYSRIKVSDVVAKAHISRSTFYFYFDSIPSAVDFMENELIELLPSDYEIAMAYQVASKPDSRYNPAGMVAKRLESKLDTFRILSGPNGRRDFQEKFHKKAVNIFRLASSSPLDDKSTEIFAEIWAGSQWYLYLWWANQKEKITAEDLLSMSHSFYDRYKGVFSS